MGARSAFGYLLEDLGRRTTSERFARYSRVSSRSNREQPTVLLEMAGIPDVMTPPAKSNASKRNSTFKRRLTVARHK